ncbi:transcriptional regulator [Methanosarcinales archaeon ex4572_44]|nr:MAG: transcriptional regulator [Methanosarcinales archaeon ex4484_138]PHP45580.1 MAG: transcriptional regulator [Methanosarcinales archaeon ex4572_44]RLG24124.1 MAG: transcriptional regulator [Methanosarcinales archaeon]RLG27562.1 MAG: transcriptional regulator [Methanosarcinales archaeon]HHI30920.1 transcriptional regulator [Candidatus Methanoperedenaceae archaeon]
MLLEYGTLVVIIVAAVVAYILLKVVKHFIVNTIIGLVILIAGNFFLGLNIAYTWIVLAICAIGGIAGALLVIILHYLGLAF